VYTKDEYTTYFIKSIEHYTNIYIITRIKLNTAKYLKILDISDNAKK